MVDFDLTQEQIMVRDLARAFALKDVAPHAHAWDEQSRFPAEAVKKMGELGLMGVAVPSEWGGAGFDTVSYVLAMEEIAAACASTAVTMSVNNSLVCDPLLKFGTDAQKAAWLTPLAEGRKLGCFAWSRRRRLCPDRGHGARQGQPRHDGFHQPDAE